MSIQEIENRIIKEAEAEAAGIKTEAQARIQALDSEHARTAAKTRAQIDQQARRRAEDVKRSLVVPARLKARKDLLLEKQKILTKIYTEIKKVKKFSDAELGKLREESEVKAAKILFG